MQFSDLKLIEPLLKAVAAEGYDVPTPIQEQAIPHILAGSDLLGCAQTGTGKTAAFALPMLQRLAERSGPARGIRALVLTPTRELAAQIGESFSTYGKHLGLRNTVIFGGVGQNAQLAALRRGVDVLVATPGRLLDLCSQGFVSFATLEIFVLDEADRMLDMGFIHDVRRIIGMLPERRQTLFFSATMPPDIQRLANSILSRPVRVEVTPVATTAEKIEQSVFFVERTDKRALLEHVLSDSNIRRVLVFTRTKHGANRVAEQLTRANIGAVAIHGNKSQNARERALASFKQGTTRVLVATDIAARGIDIEDISHVINFDLPNVPESYVHRIGRTARAGASGVALSFCDSEERSYLADIERLIRMRLPVVADHPRRSTVPAQAPRVDHGYRNDRNAQRPSQGRQPQRSPNQRPAGQRPDNRPAGQRPDNRPAGQRPDNRPAASGPRDAQPNARNNDARHRPDVRPGSRSLPESS